MPLAVLAGKLKTFAMDAAIVFNSFNSFNFLNSLDFFNFCVVLQIVLLDVLEVLVCAVLQFVGGCFVADDDGVGVHLQGADGPFLAYGALDGVLQGASLVVAVHHDEHFLGVHHGAYADGQGCLGHLVHVVVEETAVGNDGVRGETLDAGAALQGAERLVEGDVSVGADAAHEEVDAAGSLDGSLVLSAFGSQVLRVAVQDMHVLLLDVDVGEEVGPHEAVVALGVFLGQTHVFVHVEGDDVLERNLAGLVHLNEVLVEAERRRTSGTAQFERFLRCRLGCVNLGSNILGSPAAQVLVVGFDDYSHSFNAF